MRSCVKNIIALAFLCLTFEAAGQYLKAARGERVAYDSAVVVELGEYRRVRLKVALADSLVTSLTQGLTLSLQVVARQDSTVIDQAFTIATQARIIERKDQALTDLSRTYDELEALVNRPKKWYQSTGLKLGLGFVAGTAFTKWLTR